MELFYDVKQISRVLLFYFRNYLWLAVIDLHNLNCSGFFVLIN